MFFEKDVIPCDLVSAWGLHPPPGVFCESGKQRTYAGSVDILGTVCVWRDRQGEASIDRTARHSKVYSADSEHASVCFHKIPTVYRRFAHLRPPKLSSSSCTVFKISSSVRRSCAPSTAPLRPAGLCGEQCGGVRGNVFVDGGLQRGGIPRDDGRGLERRMAGDEIPGLTKSAAMECGVKGIRISRRVRCADARKGDGPRERRRCGDAGEDGNGI